MKFRSLPELSKPPILEGRRHFSLMNIMKRKLDLQNWPRKEHFEFFNSFEEPFFGITVKINCTRAYHKAKASNTSFFLYYLHASIVSANKTEPFRYRISEDNEVYVYDEINPSATISRQDGTFGFSYIKFERDFEKFYVGALEEIERVKNVPGLNPSGKDDPNVIHYSALPWIDFQSLSHARSFSYKDSCPKISFGKLVKEGDEYLMSMSVHVHHALMDGKHVGDYIDRFQAQMNA